MKSKLYFLFMLGCSPLAIAAGKVDGQHHLLPQSTDRQHITLRGYLDPSCGLSSNGLALYRVDEWGVRDKTPFVVPPLTAVIVKDIAWAGSTVNIAWPAGDRFYAALSPLVLGSLSTPVALSLSEGSHGGVYEGQTHFEAGPVFAVNSKICVLGVYPNLAVGDSWNNFDTEHYEIYNVVVHAEVVTNWISNSMTW